MGSLVEEIASLTASGKQVMLISSGAVGLGRERIGLSKEVVANVANVVERQACAAAGQELLMSTYNMMFSRLNLKCAQVLITQGDFSDRERYDYLSATLQRLSQLRVVPIINENDVVTGSSQLDPSTAGQVFGDNDTLAALIGASSEADAVLMMTDVDAVFTKPPGTPGAERIAVYSASTEFQEGAKSTMGRGGMGSKIGAARKAAQAGSNCIIANGIYIPNISKVFNGEDIGTLFPAQERATRKAFWLSHMAIPSGVLRITNEAAQALKANATSKLELSDVVASEGDFNPSSVVALHNAETFKCIGRVITAQGSDEIQV
jgi:glutamate 5-kinase